MNSGTNKNAAVYKTTKVYGPMFLFNSNQNDELSTVNYPPPLPGKLFFPFLLVLHPDWQ